MGLKPQIKKLDRTANAAGANGSVQISSNGEFSSDADLFFNSTKKVLYVSSIAAIAAGTVSRTGNFISSIALNSGRTISITRTGNFISSITDGEKTWTIARNGNNQLINWTVT